MHDELLFDASSLQGGSYLHLQSAALAVLTYEVSLVPKTGNAEVITFAPNRRIGPMADAYIHFDPDPYLPDFAEVRLNAPDAEGTVEAWICPGR